MKLTNEEIDKLWNQNAMQPIPVDAFTQGIRAAESRLLPLIETSDYLIIDTEEKRKACEPVKMGQDELWIDGTGWHPAAGDKQRNWVSKYLYRRPIQWNAVKDAPIPKDVPVWLKFEHSERPWVHATGGIISHESWGPITHWRYAQIPEPPKINPDDEAFEKWLEDQNGDLMMVNPKDEKTIEILRRCFNSGMAHGRGAK